MQALPSRARPAAGWDARTLLPSLAAGDEVPLAEHGAVRSPPGGLPVLGRHLGEKRLANAHTLRPARRVSGCESARSPPLDLRGQPACFPCLHPNPACAFGYGGTVCELGMDSVEGAHIASPWNEAVRARTTVRHGYARFPSSGRTRQAGRGDPAGPALRPSSTDEVAIDFMEELGAAALQPLEGDHLARHDLDAMAAHALEGGVAVAGARGPRPRRR